MLLFLLLHINCCNRKKCNRCFRCLVHTVEFGTVLPDQPFLLPSIWYITVEYACYSYFCGGLLATLAQHANQLATPALSQFIFTLSRTTFAGQHMAKRFTGCVHACVCVCVFGAVKMLPVSISHFVCSCSFNGFIFPAKLEKFSGFSLPLRVGHSTRCHPAHSQHRRLCATSAASWLLLIMCPTHRQTHTGTHSQEHSAYSIKL